MLRAAFMPRVRGYFSGMNGYSKLRAGGEDFLKGARADPPHPFRMIPLCLRSAAPRGRRRTVSTCRLLMSRRMGTSLREGTANRSHEERSRRVQSTGGARKEGWIG
jgi:hypothetical protein